MFQNTTHVYVLSQLKVLYCWRIKPSTINKTYTSDKKAEVKEGPVLQYHSTSKSFKSCLFFANSTWPLKKYFFHALTLVDIVAVILNLNFSNTFISKYFFV